MSALRKILEVALREKVSREYIVGITIPMTATMQSYDLKGVTMPYLRLGWCVCGGVVFYYLHDEDTRLLEKIPGKSVIVSATVNEMVLENGEIYTYLDFHLLPAYTTITHKLLVLQDVPSGTHEADTYVLAHAPRSIIVFESIEEA